MKVYTAGKVADFFRARANPEVGDVLSNLKLQKLCYYAAGIIAAVRRNDDTPLFREPIERGSTDRSYQSNTVGLGNLRRGQSQVFQTLTLGFSTREMPTC